MIKRETVEHIANLAKISLDEKEKNLLTKELGAILDYIEQLNEVDTNGIEPSAYISPEYDPLREDKPRESLSNQDILRNGPVTKNGFFAVPKVIN